MSQQAADLPLPLGARTLRRKSVSGKSLEVAEQYAAKGASAALVRAAGGDEAVEKLMHSEDAVESAAEEQDLSEA